MRTASWGRLLLLALSSTLWGRVAQAADPRAELPQVMAYAYHVAPASRLAFRDVLDRSTVPALRRLKAAGTLQDFLVLVNRQVDTGTWDAMAVLEFADASGAAAWRTVEQRQRDAVVARVRARLATNPAWKAISDGKKNVRTEGQVVVAEVLARG